MHHMSYTDWMFMIADNNDDHDDEDYHDDGNDHDDKDAEGDEDDGLTSPCLG